MQDDLTTTQVRRALAAVRELTELRDLDEFAGGTARLLRKLIPCDHATYNAIDIDSGRATVAGDPADVVFEGGAEAFGQFAYQNPLVPRARDRASGALHLSDFITRRALHRTELYDYVYRVISLEYQLVMPLPTPRSGLGRPTEIVGLSLDRARRDFSVGERLLLQQLQPHLAATLERLHELTLLRAITSAEGQDDSRMLLLIDSQTATIAWATPNAEQSLGIASGAALPPTLRTWVHTRHARAGQRGTPGDRPLRGSRTTGHVALDGRPFRIRLD